MNRLLHILIFLLSLTLIAVYYFDPYSDWKKYQKRYKRDKIEKLQIQYQKSKDEAILKDIENFRNFKIEKRGIYVSKWKREEYCITCHIGIEEISESHPINVFGCIVCHGGDPLSIKKDDAHKGLIGKRNPSDMKFVNKSCGTKDCHDNDIKRVETSLMFSMGGVIADLRYQWNSQKSKSAIYATNNIEDKKGRVLKRVPFYSKDDIPPSYQDEYEVSGEIADSHFRKFCSMCHIGANNPNSTSNHSSGCSACHVLYDNSSKYKGDDPTIDRGEEGHPTFHKMTKKIPTSQCLHCHNRSNRYGTSYVGIMENDFYGTPYSQGSLSENELMGGRNFFHMGADVHFQKGMECIDCHTSNDIMGDGLIYDKMEQVVEIRCEDCHGDYKNKPEFYDVSSLRDDLISSFDNININDQLLKNKKGSILSHIKREGNKIYLFTKISDKKLEIKTISNDPKHKTNQCNKNFECYTCHFKWTPLCYGCHIGYNPNFSQRDFLTGFKSMGMWYEYRSYTRFEDTVLGINSKGKISPMQFCQSQLTFPDKNFDNKVFIHDDNTTSFAVAPVQPHTVTKLSKRCHDCHNNPMAVGLGKGYLELADNDTIIFKPIYDIKSSGVNVDFPFESIVSHDGKIQYQSLSNENFKVFNSEDIIKILRVGKCIFCHNSYEDKIYKENNFKYYYDKVKVEGFKHIQKYLDSKN